MNLILDTSGLIHFLQKQPHAVNALAQADRILVPVIVVGELLAGAQVPSKKNQMIQEFLIRPRVAVQVIDADTPTYYAHLLQFLKKRGTPIPTNDLWIAASTMQTGARILTSDAHFLRLPQLLVDYIEA
jgi:tRNA(fMet)-specific endonuclease VapC